MSGKRMEASKEGKTDGASRKNALEFMKFALVGVMNTAVDFLVFTVLTWAGVYYLVAQIFSYAAGTLNSYVVNKLWTFRGKGETAGGRGMGAEAVRFAALNAAALLLSLALLYLLKDGLHVPALLAKLLVTGVTVVFNYVGSKLWVFK